MSQFPIRDPVCSLIQAPQQRSPPTTSPPPPHTPHSPRHCLFSIVILTSVSSRAVVLSFPPARARSLGHVGQRSSGTGQLRYPGAAGA